MAVKHKCFTLLFDIFSGTISLLDLSTDLIILIQWYNQDRMVFFWISCCILFMAQCSYLALFHCHHGAPWTLSNVQNERFFIVLVTFLFTVPFAPFLSFIFHFVAENDSKLRRWIDKLPIITFRWHNEFPNEPKTSKEHLEQAAFKHAGFLLEAAVEAFPQSILQLIAIVYYNEPDIISIISVLISLSSVSIKLLVMVLVVLEIEHWRVRLLVWLSFVTDFIGIFFVVSFAFYQPTNQNLQSLFSIIGQTYFWLFIIGTLPTTVSGCFGFYLYNIMEMLRNDNDYRWESYASSCFVGCCLCIPFVGGLLAITLFLQIMCLSLISIPLLVFGVDDRMYLAAKSLPFYHQQIKWILKSRTTREQIGKICVFNLELEKLKIGVTNSMHLSFCKSDSEHKYLENESKTRFENVSFSSLRSHCDEFGNEHDSYRKSSYFLEAFWHSYCRQLTMRIKNMKTSNPVSWGHKIMDYIELCTLYWITHLSFPIYLFSKVAAVLMPLFIVIYLYVNGDGVILFLDVDTFQVTMWCLYVSTIIVWFCLSYAVVRREYILWHLQPTNEYFFDVQNYGNKLPKLKLDIAQNYESIEMYPIIKEYLYNLFSDDVSTLILDYFDSIQME